MGIAGALRELRRIGNETFLDQDDMGLMPLGTQARQPIGDLPQCLVPAESDRPWQAHDIIGHDGKRQVGRCSG